MRLQPQMDRLLHAAAVADQDDLTMQAGAVQFVDDDGRQHGDGPNLDDMVFSEDENGNGGKVYKAPRVSSMTYPRRRD